MTPAKRPQPRERQEIHAILLAIFLVLFFAGLNVSYPFIGNDYLYFFDRLHAGIWHVQQQGIFPFRFTASFCGGMPQYGNPHDISYSLLQALSLFFSFWTATQLTLLFMLLAGYAAWYRIGRDVLRFRSAWSHVFALTVTANGFYFMHMVVGHVAYHTLPLMGVLLWLLLKPPEESTRERCGGVSLFALTTACILYASGYFVLMVTLCTYLLALPVLFFILPPPKGEKAPSQVRAHFFRTLLYGESALLLCMSKLVAIYSLMRFFPRYMPFDIFYGNVPLFIARAFWGIPQSEALFLPGAIWGVHEYSIFLSPLTLIGLFGLLPYLYWKLRGKMRSDTPLLLAFAAAYALLLLIGFVELTQGFGAIPAVLEKLPILSSTHVTARFLYIFSLFLSALSIFCIAGFADTALTRKGSNLLAVVGSAITLFAFAAAYTPLLFSNELTRGTAYHNMEGSFHTFDPPIMKQEGSCEDPVFMGIGKYPIPPLAKGDPEQGDGIFFNLYNPACLQYPETNFCKPGARIFMSDWENFQNFRWGRAVTWQISSLQRWSDAISLLALAGCLVGISMYAKRKPVTRK